MQKVSVGITTYKRPDYFKDCIDSVTKHLLPLVDDVAIYNDGSRLKDYQPVYETLDRRIHIEHKNKNKGVAHAKNWLMKRFLRSDSDYLFLLEDDLIIKSPKAVFGYLKVAKETGIGHLLYAHHGPMNKDRCIHSDPNGIELYPNCVGAWCMYSREALEDVGILDEQFSNAYEHVEHTHRLAIAEYTADWPYFADVKGSADWITEQPDSIENSSIRKSKDWALNSIRALSYWQQKDPENFPFYPLLKDIKEKYS